MTKKSLPIVTSALILALSACSKEPESGATTAAATEFVPDETVSEPVAETSGSVTPAPVLADAIPATLRGRWGLVPADCTSTAGDAKGLLTVSDDQLKFYESVAKLGTVKAAAADSVTGSFAFTGEGQTWTLDVTLSSPDGGKTMVRTDKGPDAAPAPLTYTKCT